MGGAWPRDERKIGAPTNDATMEDMFPKLSFNSRIPGGTRRTGEHDEQAKAKVLEFIYYTSRSEAKSSFRYLEAQ